MPSAAQISRSRVHREGLRRESAHASGVNAAVSGDSTIYRSEINVGIAVALDWGLIVPVIKHADELSLIGIARAINDLGERPAQEAAAERQSNAARLRSPTRRLRPVRRDSDHQPAAGCDPGRRRDREASQGGDRSRRHGIHRHSHDGDADDGV